MTFKTASTLVVLSGLILFCGTFATTYIFGLKNQKIVIPPIIFQNEVPKCLSNQFFSNIKPALEKPSEVCALNITNETLPILAANAKRFSNLKMLFANNQNITSIPPEIGQITSLLVLDLRSNNLSNLPLESLQSLHLTLLRLDGNPLSSNKINSIRKALPQTSVLFAK